MSSFRENGVCLRRLNRKEAISRFSRKVGQNFEPLRPSLEGKVQLRDLHTTTLSPLDSSTLDCRLFSTLSLPFLPFLITSTLVSLSSPTLRLSFLLPSVLSYLRHSSPFRSFPHPCRSLFPHQVTTRSTAISPHVMDSSKRLELVEAEQFTKFEDSPTDAFSRRR